MSDPANRLRLQIGINAEAEALEDARVQLERELVELHVPIRAAPGPGGPQGAGPGTMGTLVVAVGRQAIGPLVQTVRSWVARRSSRSVRLELDGDVVEVTGITREGQDRLIDAWVRHHGSTASGQSGLPGDPDTDF